MKNTFLHQVKTISEDYTAFYRVVLSTEIRQQDLTAFFQAQRMFGA
jgi:hypothetical protein